MRIRKLVLGAAAAILPLGLGACGGAGVEDFCAQYQAIDEIAPEDADQAKGELEELADTVPDQAGDDVREAVELMADAFPADGDIAGAVENGDLDEEEAEEFLAAAQTVTAYGDETCSE